MECSALWCEEKYCVMKTGIVRWVVPYAGPILLCLALGTLASWLQQGALETWYPYLRKSPLTPPGYEFPVAWTLLYVLIGLAFGAVWHAGAKGSGTRGRCLLVLWSVQCLLNFLWSVCFFFGRMPWTGFGVIVLLLVSVVAFLCLAWRHNRWAFGCFVPYLLWLAFAAYLNLYVCLYN